MNPQLTSGVAQGIAAGAMWGLVFLAPQVLHDFGALQLSAARYLAYGVIAALLLAPRARALLARLGRTDWLAALALALLGNIVYYLCLATAVQWAGGAAAALVIGLVPLAVTLAGARQHDAVPLRALAGPLVLGLVGTALVGLEALSADPAGSGVGQRATGLLCAFGALACWTGYSVVNQRWLARRPDLSAHDAALLVGVVTGGLALGLAAAAFGPGTAPRPTADWLRLAAGGTVVALCASVVGNACWNRATRQLPLAMTGQMIVFETLFGLLYGYLWVARWPTALEALATACLLAGVAWAAVAHGPVTARAGTRRGPSFPRPSASSRARG